MGFMRKNTIVRDLIKVLEFKPMNYSEMQDFVFYHQSRPVNLNNIKSRGYWCTLDLDVSEIESLLETGLTEHHKFIPMISVKLPYLQQLGYNATIKLDDRDFAATNPGVWCHQLHDLLNRNKFTNWSQYTQDEVIR
jgi:hypothetical protein